MSLVDDVKSNQASAFYEHLYDANKQEITAAFHEACIQGNFRFVESLLENDQLDPRAPSSEAVEYAFNPNQTGSYGLQMAAYHGHSEVVNLLLKDKRSDVTAGEFRCIKLIIDKAETNDTYLGILRQLSDYCWDNWINYKSKLGSETSNKIDSILNQGSAQYSNGGSYSL